MSDQTDATPDEPAAPSLKELVAQAKDAIKPDSDLDPGKEAKKSILRGQVDQFKQTRFNHQTNITRLLALPDDTDGKAVQLKENIDAIAVYDQHIAATEAALAELG